MNETSAVSESEQAPNTWLNALLGAAVTVFLSFIPFSPVLGGAVAGYLEGGEIREGGRVGVLSGIFAAIPVALIIVLVVLFGLIVSGEPLFALLGVISLVGVIFYVVALGAVGGVLGVYVKEEV